LHLLGAIRLRRTTNSKFRPDPIRPEHVKGLIEAAVCCLFTSKAQPWRFVLVLYTPSILWANEQRSAQGTT
jgi:nitroreductase